MNINILNTLYRSQRWAGKSFFNVGKSANFLDMSVGSKNPQIFMIRIRNPKVSTKNCTILSENGPKSRLLYEILRLAKVLSPLKAWVHKSQIHKWQIRKSKTNVRSTNHKSTKCHICGRSTNLTNYLNPQICSLRNLFVDRPPLTKVQNSSSHHRQPSHHPSFPWNERRTYPPSVPAVS
jgi:hypothetical protein